MTEASGLSQGPAVVALMTFLSGLEPDSRRAGPIYDLEGEFVKPFPNMGLRGDDDYFTRNAMFTFRFVSTLLLLQPLIPSSILSFFFISSTAQNVGKTEYTEKQVHGKTDSLRGGGLNRKASSEQWETALRRQL